MRLVKGYDNSWSIYDIPDSLIMDIVAQFGELEEEYYRLIRPVPTAAGSVIKINKEYYMRRIDGCWTSGSMEYLSDEDIRNTPWEGID